MRPVIKFLAAAFSMFMSLSSVDARACEPATPNDATSPVLTNGAIEKALPALLAAEGLKSAMPAAAVVRRADLDGDATTEEALVDVISADLCGPALACPTLIVVIRGGQIGTIGHGTALTVLQSRTSGWVDLGVQSPTLVPFVFAVTRALRWSNFRYG
jgi:hypothetical protein